MKRLLFALMLVVFAPALAFAAGDVNVSYPGAPGPLFNITNMAPGDSVTQTIVVTNNSTAAQTFKFQAGSTQAAGILADRINIRVTNVGTSAEKHNNSLASLLKAGEVSLGSIAPAAPTSFAFVATMDKDAGNEYMGLSESFNLEIGFAAAPAPTTPLRAFASTLGFTAAPTPVVVTDTPTVAGAQTGETPAVKGAEDAAVKGSADITCPWWWIVALVLAVALAFIGGVIRALEPEKFLRKYYYVWPPLLAVIAWASHYYLHGTLQATWFCNNYWLVVLLLAVLGESVFVWIVRSKN